MAPAQVETALAAMRDRLSHELHDVEQWPLFTVEAAQLSEERVRFCVGFDVLIGDAWSFQLLGWEMAQSLQGQPLPPLNLTFRDYVLAEQAFRQSPGFSKGAGLLAESPTGTAPGPGTAPGGGLPAL